MTELKTLKDIEAGMSEHFDIFYKNLKAEAVKWVNSKELQCHEGDNHTKEWIKHFFNLKKKDSEKNEKEIS